MKFVETSAGKIAYEESGSGPGLVLLHSVGHDHRDFDAVKSDLAASFRVIALDWPGHGGSSPPHDPSLASAPALADLLEEIVPKLHLENSIFLGNSIGGFAAARLAIRRPQWVRALVLVDSGGFNDPDLMTRFFCKYLKGSRPGSSLLWNVLPALYFRRRNDIVRSIRTRIKARKNPESVAMDASLWRSFVHPDHDLRTSAANIQAPTLLVWGKQDPVIRVSTGREAGRIIPGARLSVLKTGHVPFAEDPGAFLSVVMPFLKGLT